MVFWVIAGSFSLIGLLVMVGGFNKLFRIKIFSGFTRTVVGLALTSIGVAAGLIGMNFQQYNRLIYEQDIATLRFEQVEPQYYAASLKRADSGLEENYKLQGDEWRMEAHVLKFKPWANVIGLDSHYKLDRLEGRYQRVNDELSKKRTIYALSDEPGLDMQQVVQSKRAKKYKISQLVDAEYGAGVFVPMAHGAEYKVSLAQSGGLIARPANDAAKEAVQGWHGSDEASHSDTE